jgi:hypothetical protein
MKTQTNAGEQPRIYFIRDQYGEADCVFEATRGLAIAEIKAASTYAKEHSAKMTYFAELLNVPVERRYLIYKGETQTRSGVKLINICDIQKEILGQ